MDSDRIITDGRTKYVRAIRVSEEDCLSKCGERCDKRHVHVCA